jgi:hypothetical protein
MRLAVWAAAIERCPRANRAQRPAVAVDTSAGQPSTRPVPRQNPRLLGGRPHTPPFRALVWLVLGVMVAACGSSESTSTPGASAATRSGEPTSTVPSAPSSGSVTSSGSVSPGPSPAARPWKTYRSARFRYSLKYPPDWVVTPGSAKLPDTFDDFKRFVYVSRTTISGTVSLSLTIAFETNYLKSHYRAKLLTSASLTAAGWPAKLLTFRATRDGRMFYVQELIAVKGSTAYFLVWWSDQGNAAADRSVFRRIFGTFRRI